MPKESKEPKRSKPAAPRKSGGTVFNVQGGIHIGRDFVDGGQVNYYLHNEQIANITRPDQFVDELQKLRDEIEKLKSQSGVEPAAGRRLAAVAGDVQDAMDEAQKEKPAPEKIRNTLDGAKETMEKLGGSIAAAVNLGTSLGNLALLAWKVFGGG
jgi:uncharacterized protein (DUF2342 family)